MGFRVLHIGNEISWRGGENQVRLLIAGLRPFGVESFVAYPRESRGFARFAELRGSDGPVEVLPLPSRRAFDPRNIRDLVRFCDVHDIQILDAQSSGGMSMALKVKKRRPKLCLVVHRRVDNPIKRSWLTRRKYLNPRVNRFVCISAAIGQIVREYGVNPDLISIVPSAVEETPYIRLGHNKIEAKKILAGRAVPLDTVWIGNASAFTSQKGHDTFIRACQILQSRSVPFVCWFAGDGPLLAKCKHLAEDLNLQHSVRFIGHTKSVTNFVLALDVLAVPSNNEGLGTILLEGAYAGCALVGSNVGGIPEIVRQGETGFLVAPGNAEELADRLETLIRDADIRAKLSSAARDYVRSHFSVEQMVRGNLAVYQGVLKAASHRPS